MMFIFTMILIALPVSFVIRTIFLNIYRDDGTPFDHEALAGRQNARLHAPPSHTPAFYEYEREQSVRHVFTIYVTSPAYSEEVELEVPFVYYDETSARYEDIGSIQGDYYEQAT